MFPQEDEVMLYCQMVRRGKPAACMAIQNRYMEEAMEKVARAGLQIHIEGLADGWYTLWIYKQDFMLDVIKSLPDKPNTIYEHWILGKAFGYSDEAIAEFVRPLCTKFCDT